MSKVKEPYPEIQDIRHDLDSLKNNVVELTKHIKQDGFKTTREIKRAAWLRIGEARKSGEKQLKKVEASVKKEPAKSLAIAFASGLILSALMRRR